MAHNDLDKRISRRVQQLFADDDAPTYTAILTRVRHALEHLERGPAETTMYFKERVAQHVRALFRPQG